MTRNLMDPGFTTVLQTDDYLVSLHPLAGEVDEFGNLSGVVTMIGQVVHVGAAQRFIPPARATELVASARAIRTALGC